MNRFVLPRWNKAGAALGEQGNRNLVEFLGPRHRLVCNGAGGRAGLFPDDHPARPEIIATFQKLCGGVVNIRIPKTGLWYQVLDQVDRRAITWKRRLEHVGLRDGQGCQSWLPAPVLCGGDEKGYQGIVEHLVKHDGDGKWSLTQCCSVSVARRVARQRPCADGSFDYYVGEPVVSNDLKGVGPFILAGIEVQQLLKERGPGKKRMGRAPLLKVENR